jgi:alpha-ketoglutarate-dependent taurine dioxygenase
MDSIEGLSTAEGTELLNSLYAHVLKPEFVYVHAWRPGDVLIWDNLALMHRLVDVPPLPRILHRTHTRA